MPPNKLLSEPNPAERITLLQGSSLTKRTLRSKMRKLSIGLVIAASLLISCTALAQGKMDHMQGHKMSGNMKGHMMSKADQKVMACMMQGISKDEMATLHKDMG